MARALEVAAHGDGTTVVRLFVLSSKRVKSVLQPYSDKLDNFAWLIKKAYPPPPKAKGNGKASSLQKRVSTLKRMDHTALQSAEQRQTRTLRETAFKYSALVWDVVQTACVLFQAASYLWALCFFSAAYFHKTTYLGPLALNWCIDALFVVDTALAMNPAWTSRRNLHCVYFYPTRPGGTERRIKRQRKDLLMDIAVAIPFELLLLGGGAASWKTVYIYLLRSLKWLRVRYIGFESVCTLRLMCCF